MYLENLSVLNFKNYSELELSFSSQINCFVGKNGSGKTNLLDAIHYLCLTKSAFNAVDSQNIKHNEDFFLVKGNFKKNEKSFRVSCNLKTGHKKVFQVNKKKYERISEHVGEFPVVLIAPDDTELIKGGSENRRKFFDSILSQIDQQYLNQLIRYTNLLKQRNSLLKQFHDKNYFDKDILDIYDTQLIETGENIYTRRKKFLEEFEPLFKIHYEDISDYKEKVNMNYSSDYAEKDFLKNFKSSLKKDIALQRTTKGVHKDDFLFSLNDHSLKKFGSQGQIKSYLIALKLAQFDCIKKEKGINPVLLLDDIFDKLDDSRIQKLIRMVASHSFGQIFLTDARPERSMSIFNEIEEEKKYFNIADGEAVEIFP